jgi:hypothetical protein
MNLQFLLVHGRSGTVLELVSLLPQLHPSNHRLGEGVWIWQVSI